MDDSKKPRRIASPDVVETNDGVVLQHEDRIHTLNATAREIYELCDGSRSVAAIIGEMVTRYESDEHFDSAGIESHVRECIGELVDAGLIAAD